jgi:hypothetical protein
MDLGLPFPSSSSPAPGFRPACKITQGAASSSSGGLLDTVASLLSAPQADPWADNLRSVEIAQGPAPFLDTCRLWLARTSTTPAVAVGDELGVQLGFDGSLATVFTGKVVVLSGTRDQGLEAVLASPAHLLAQSRQNASFEQQTLGDVVRQWAGEAQVTAGNVDSGASFPFLAVDDRRSAWEWIGALARLAGLLAWIDAEGKLNCKQPAGTPVRTYRYGQDLLRPRFIERVASLGEVTVSGEGAAQSQGAKAWSWLAKSADSVQASAGDGAPKRLYQEGVLREHAAAAAAAEGIAQRAHAARSVIEVAVPGSAEVGVGALFALADCPGGRGDGIYVALRVRHRYAKAHGFFTQLHGLAA